MVITKANQLRILSLVQAICIDKERLTLNTLDKLALVLESLPQTDWRIRIHLEEVTSISITTKYRRIMSGITEVKTSCGKVYQSDKHCDKHTVLVILCKFIIDAITYFGW